MTTIGEKRRAAELARKIQERADRTTFPAERETALAHVARLVQRYKLGPADFLLPAPSAPPQENQPRTPPPDGPVAVYIDGQLVGHATSYNITFTTQIFWR